eukprot:Gb_39109 [translate_table: standard]
MGRRRVEFNRIENRAKRQVTFSKRRNGLLKKAWELSVLCDAEVALVIFSSTGKIYEFASHGMKETLEKYRNVSTTNEECSPDNQSVEFSCSEVEILRRKREALQATQKNMIGEDLGSLSFDDLLQIEGKLQLGANAISSRKEHLLQNKIEILQKKLIEQQNSIETSLELSIDINCRPESNVDGYEFPADSIPGKIVVAP